MDSDGRLFGKGREPAVRAELLAAYEKLCADGFRDLDRFSAAELEWVQRIHDRRLEYFREERRMHFGAFLLVGLALVILLPAVLTLTDTDYFIPLAAVEILLIVLFVPYTFVYRKYEEGVRRMMREAFLIENSRRIADERRTKDV